MGAAVGWEGCNERIAGTGYCEDAMLGLFAWVLQQYDVGGSEVETCDAWPLRLVCWTP